MTRYRGMVTTLVFIVLLLVGGFIYVRHVYFFNPILFRNSKILTLPYKEYRNPLYIEYDFYTKDGKQTDVLHNVSFERKDIENVISALHSAQPSPTTPDKSLLGTPGMMEIFLRQQGLPNKKVPGPILLTARIYTTQNAVAVLQPDGKPPYVVALPKQLHQILESKRKTATTSYWG